MAPPIERRRAGWPLFAITTTAALLLMSSAIADTQHPCQTDAMIVFDASGSMGTSDYSRKVPRIASVKSAMRKVVPEIADLRRLGLIVYGEGEYNNCDSIELRLRPTPNAAATILAQIEAIFPRGRTPLTQSVSLAAETLDYKNQPATIVLLTDGEETCGGDPCRTAASLKKLAKNLTIHVIGYRHGPAGYFTARCMADATGGEFVTVDNEDALIEALRKTLGCPFLTERRGSHSYAQSFSCP